MSKAILENGTLAELRGVLINEHAYEANEVNGLAKSELRQLLKGEMEVVEALDQDLEIEEDSTEKDDVPLMTSPLWSDYVIAQLSSEEMFDGRPTVDGLRRVTEILLGPIVESLSEVKQVPDETNNHRATIVHTVRIDLGEGDIRSFSGAADSYAGNTADDYRLYPVSIAETRAEGRALRRALKVRGVVAEEVSGKTAPPSSATNDEKINENQINMIDMLCRNNGRGLNISVKAFQPDIKKLTYEQAQAAIKTLSEYQNDKSTIPAEVIGYDPDWRK